MKYTQVLCVPIINRFSLYFFNTYQPFISRSLTIINHFYLKFDTESLVTEGGLWIGARDYKTWDRRCKSWERKSHVLDVAEWSWSLQASPFTELAHTFRDSTPKTERRHTKREITEEPLVPVASWGLAVWRVLLCWRASFKPRRTCFMLNSYLASPSWRWRWLSFSGLHNHRYENLSFHLAA